jgi:hypothetical protein
MTYTPPKVTKAFRAGYDRAETAVLGDLLPHPWDVFPGERDGWEFFKGMQASLHDRNLGTSLNLDVIEQDMSVRTTAAMAKIVAFQLVLLLMDDLAGRIGLRGYKPRYLAQVRLDNERGLQGLL